MRERVYRSIRSGRRAREKAWPSLAALPEVPEHGLCGDTGRGGDRRRLPNGRLGVKVATGLPTAHAEAGEDGSRARPRRLARDRQEIPAPSRAIEPRAW